MFIERVAQWFPKLSRSDIRRLSLLLSLLELPAEVYKYRDHMELWTNGCGNTHHFDACATRHSL